MDLSRRKLIGTASGLTVASSVFTMPAFANNPVKIGMSMPMTGGLGAGGKAALIAIRLWVEDVNSRGGLLGRKVEFTAYDDQTNPANTPGIYSKLLDVDKVDLLIAPYGTVHTAPILPLVKQRGKLLMGNFSYQVNMKVKHDMWFNNFPVCESDYWFAGFLQAAKESGAKTIAITASDQEFAQNLTSGVRNGLAKTGLTSVYDQNYPPTTKDFSTIVRAIRAAKPDVVFVASYPPDSVGIVNAAHEIGLGSQVKIFGGGMVGLQFAPIMESLGSKLNGIINYNTFVPGMKVGNIEGFLKRYAVKAAEEKVDLLGFYIPPFNYAIGQILEQAITATKSIEDKILAAHMRSNSYDTIVGPIKFDANGERNQRLVMAQFRGVKDNDVEQFRSSTRQVVIHPSTEKTGEPIYPYDKARRA